MRSAYSMSGATAAKCTCPTLTYRVGDYSSLLRFDSTRYKKWLAAEEASQSKRFDLPRFQVWRKHQICCGTLT